MDILKLESVGGMDFLGVRWMSEIFKGSLKIKNCVLKMTKSIMHLKQLEDD